MVSKEIFKQIFDEFASAKAAKLDYYFEQAQRQVDETAFGESYEHAVYLRLAHMLTLLSEKEKASSGHVSAERVGDISYSYAFITGEDSLSQTQYGIEFIELRKENVVAVVVL